MLIQFEAGGLHPRMAYVLDGEPAFAGACASASRFTLRKSPLRVKLRKPQAEHMLSGLPSITDMSEPRRDFRGVPKAEV